MDAHNVTDVNELLELLGEDYGVRSLFEGSVTELFNTYGAPVIGSTRMVFTSDDFVFKVPLNRKGVTDSLKEAELSRRPDRQRPASSSASGERPSSGWSASRLTNSPLPPTFPSGRPRSTTDASVTSRTATSSPSPSEQKGL